MHPERWDKLNELFHAALRRRADERHAFLIGACGGDGTLIRDVRRLLSAHERTDAILGESVFDHPIAVFPPAEEPPAVGRRLGPYRIVRQLGRGGMGSVYLAQRADQQYEKRVAVKLVKRGAETDDVVRLFRDERQILATLEHPNIARLLDGGTTEDGLPYFVMEYVEGRPVDEYCDASRLSIEERVRLFLQVCGAVAHAHQYLVVHRDLKPSNILVTAEGVPKLLDFGIASIMYPGPIIAPGPTSVALRPMTPDYASPEQLHGGAATTLSDVYSLGVVLYELLAGRRPYRFQSCSLAEVARAIDSIEPPRPSAAASRRGDAGRLRGDLDAIVLKAMHKDRARRYQSIEQLSTDLQRYLEGLPVAARGDSLPYRVSRLMRRNRTAVSAAAVVLLTLIGGMLATSWQAHRARLQETVARAEQARAESRFSDLRRLARAVLFDYHEAVKEDPIARRGLAISYRKLALLQRDTGDIAGALETSNRALDLFQSLVRGEPSNDELRAELGRTYADLADARQIAASLGTAVDEQERRAACGLYRQSLEIWNDLRGRGMLSDIDRPRSEAVTREVGRCDRRVAGWP